VFGKLEFARPHGSPQQLPDNQGRDAYPAENHKRCEQRFQNISKSDRIAEEFNFLMSLFPKASRGQFPYCSQFVNNSTGFSQNPHERNRALIPVERKDTIKGDLGTFPAEL
jgi:hypothetical protein